MNVLTDTLKDLLVDAGIGEFAGASDWGIYIAYEPDSPDKCITLFDTGGPTAQVRLDRDLGPQDLTFQLRVRSMTYDEGMEECRAVRDVFALVKNMTAVEGTDTVQYAAIIEQQREPTPLARDKRQRFIFTWNFRTRRWVVS